MRMGYRGISPRLRGRTRRIVMRDSALARITLLVAPYVNYLPWDRQSRGMIYRLTRFAACEVFVLSGGPLIRVTPRLWAEDCVGGLVVVQTISRRHMCALQQFCLRTVFGWGEVPKVTLWLCCLGDNHMRLRWEGRRRMRSSYLCSYYYYLYLLKYRADTSGQE